MALLVGSSAPDFTLRGWYDGAVRDYSLAAELKSPMVLAFYPGDERIVCTRQMCAYSDQIDQLRGRDVQVWAVAPQDLHSHREFAQGHSLRIPLLSDTSGIVARSYGIVGPVGLRRSVFVVGADGRIAWRWVSTLGLRFPGVQTLREAVDGVAKKVS